MIGYLAAGALPVIIIAVALPLLIHLLSKKVSNRRTFPGIVFLRRMKQGQSSFHKIKDLLAVLLRVVCLILCVLACAGIYWSATAASSSDAAAIVILDASVSMNQQANGSIVFEQARGQCDQLLKELRSRPCALYIAGDQLQTVHKKPGLHSSQNRAMLNTATVSYGSGSLPQAVALAKSNLQKNDEIYIITDLSRHALDGIDFALLQRDYTVHVITAGTGSENVGITNIGIQPGIGIVGQSMRVAITVENYTNRAFHGSMAVTFDARESVHRLACEAQSQQIVHIDLTPDKPGDIIIRAELVTLPDEDSLEQDNIRYGCMHVRDSIPASIISDAALSDRHGGLLPVYASLSAAQVDVDVVRSNAAATMKRHGGLIATVDLHQPIDDHVINEHVSAGGTWLSIIHSINDANVNNKMKAIRSPLVLGERINAREQSRGAIQYAEADLEHRALHRFLGRETMFEEVEVYRYHLTPKEPDAEVKILLTYADGSIALAERRIGNGRIYVWNTSPAPPASNIAALDLLPLLLHSAAQSSIPSEKARIALDVGARVAARVSVINQHTAYAVPITGMAATLNRPGIYRIDDQETVCVAMPATESNPEQLDEKLLQHMEVQHTAYGTLMAGASNYPLWGWCLLLVVCLLLCESLLLRSPERRRGAA